MNSRSSLLVSLTTIFLIGCRSQPGTEASPPGSVLFKTRNCYTCHTIGHGKLVGPDLKGLFLRREEDWVRRYIQNPTAMTQSDPIAIQLKEEYRTQMPATHLSPAELDALMDYLKTETR